MSFWMTQSLLSSWKFYMHAEDTYADRAHESFLSTLRRERKAPTRAMQTGVDFESDINALAAGRTVEPVSPKWDGAVRRFSKICAGGQAQAPVSGELSVSGMDFVLYGVCDYVKAGIIYDIKKVTRYEYGKYADSPQHPMYLHLVPEAARFDYLIFDGSFCYRETYRRGDYTPIEQTISEFVRFLRDTGHMDDYTAHWAMNAEREDKRHGI